MNVGTQALQLLAQEARALLTRLARVRPFALLDAMVPAAALLPNAQSAIEHHLLDGRHQLQSAVQEFLQWVQSPAALATGASEAQRRFTLLKLRFNAVIAQFALFNDVIVQRSEHETGVWLSGLDVVATDALQLPGHYYATPPVICYLDSNLGAAIRRARTRLPGGGANPVAIVRLPRERMVGVGLASSLIHEVGHQAAALLDLVNSLRPQLQAPPSQQHTGVWSFWPQWISEIVSDLWSVARVGIAATTGLIGVMSLPRPFVFRLNGDDPHPIPWLRVLLSCALGNAFYPHPQWSRLGAIWQSLYPLRNATSEMQRLLTQLQASMPQFIDVLLHHRPPALRGQTLQGALEVERRQPARLAALFHSWRAAPASMYRAAPSLVFAVLGQARADGQLTPEDESELLQKLLTQWALRKALDTASTCAAAAQSHRDRRACRA